MNHFEYRKNILFVEDVDIRDITESVGSPCYIYSRATLERHWHAFDAVFADYDHLICYAVKANSSLAVLNLFARLGSGFDIVSLGELERVLKAGGEASKIVFSGVGKTATEMRRALDVGVMCFNVESEAELVLLNAVAGEMSCKAKVSLRVNPDVDAKTHPYISTGLKQNKFGIGIDRAKEAYSVAADMAHIDIHGIDCHIGSQLCEIEPFIDALDRVLLLIDELKQLGIIIKHIDVGGGLGIRYNDETPPSPAAYAEAILAKLKDTGLQVLCEPGRAIVGNAGVLITQVQFLKAGEEKHFAVIDAAMNDLLRPALYQAWQDIIPVVKRASKPTQLYDVVGPICETGDFLGKDRNLSLEQGDLLAICSAGAYGFTMSSNYNSRPRVAEVMVDKDNFHIIRERETITDLFKGESLLPL